MAKQLKEFKKDVDGRIGKGDKKDVAILKELQKIIKDSKKIRFEGNGYGDEWVVEAEKRGLSNFKDTPRALKVLSDKRTEKLYEEMGIFTPVELEARYEIELENYTLKLQIEARMIEDLAKNHVIPTALIYQNRLIKNVQGLKEIFSDKEYKSLASVQLEFIKEISERIGGLKKNLDLMLTERKKANVIGDAAEKAIAYCDKVKFYFESISYNINKLETTVDDELWPFPKVRELLFTK